MDTPIAGGPDNEPYFVVQISWDKADTDHTYLTSTPRAQLPVESPGVDRIDGVVLDISGQTQKINPDIATSTIGSVTIKVSDKSAQENRLLYSEEFDNASWTKADITVTSNAITAPDGSGAADKLEDISAVSNAFAMQAPFTLAVGMKYTMSCYLKKGTTVKTYLGLFNRTAMAYETAHFIDWTTEPPTLNLQAGTGTGALITVGNGWYRLVSTSAAVTVGTALGEWYIFPAEISLGTPDGYVYAWGAQFSESDGAILYSITTDTAILSPHKAITKKINEKLSAGAGLRGKITRVYVGAPEHPFENYSLRLTYINDQISYKDNVYTLNISDIQRATRSKIFTPDETNLAETTDENSLIIPVTSSDTTKFPLVSRGTETSNFPGLLVSYIKIEKEVIAINSQVQFDTTNGWHINALQRGALGTRAVQHAVDTGATDNRKPSVKEHIFLEGAAPKVIYGLYTGLLYSAKNYLIEQFNLSLWGKTGSPTVTATTDATPTDWGSGWNVKDNSAVAFEGISLENSVDYVHGATWALDIFVKKELSSTTTRISLLFNNGAATSNIFIQLDKFTGAIFASGSSGVVVASVVEDYDATWWRLTLSGYSVTTGTTSVSMQIIPDISAASGVGDSTYFLPCLMSGDVSGPTILPTHWNLGIDGKFVKLSDFQNIGNDLWNTTDNSGRPVRIENPGSQDGKRFIETQILVWLGAFVPIYASGELGLKRLTRILAGSAYYALLDQSNVISYSAVRHEMQKVINSIRVLWNYVDSREDFTKESIFIDAPSVAKHLVADRKEYEFKTVHTGAHTDENILAYFDTLRDRYSGPPLTLSLAVLPSMNSLEVGDTVRVKLDQVRDFNTGTTLDRTFEAQQITTNWTTGAIGLSLFGSSQAAGALDKTVLSSVMADAWYVSAGTALTSVLTIVGGAVTVSGTVTGHADLNNTAAIFYYDGDLTINAGITVTVTANVQLRIKGNLTINGAIDGAAQGPAGGAATTQFVGGGTSDAWNSGRYTWDPLADIDINLGDDGYFGIPVSGGSFFFNSSANPPTSANNASVALTNGWNNWPSLLGASKGSITTLPFFDIANPNGTILDSSVGLPSDLRGHGGPSGMVATNRVATGFSGTQYINANGGAGGNGGAGLCVICRGMSFGGSGSIDLSGGDSGAPTTLVASGLTFHGGHGAPGAPGGFLLLIDGDHTNPDIDDTVFTAAYGSVVSSGTPTEIGIGGDGAGTLIPNGANMSNWPWIITIVNLGVFAATQDADLWESAYRIQYLPEAEEPLAEFGAGVLERGKYNDLLLFQNAVPPTANHGYGADVTITPDGSRFSVLASQSGADTLYIVRNAKNPEREQSLTLATSAAESITISQDGLRILVLDGTFNTVYVYARTGVIWALEQTLTFGSAAIGASGFGDHFTWNESADRLMLKNNVANFRIEYWSRSGTTWTFQEVIPEPATVSSSYPSGMSMSQDGRYLLTADGENPAYSGSIHLFKFTGASPNQWELMDSITVPGFDLTSPPTTYRLGKSLLPYRAGVFTNYDGSAVVASGLDSDLVHWIHTIERQDDKLKYISGYDLLTPTGDVGALLKGISNNGLLALVVDTRWPSASPPGSGAGHVFRRNNISEAFKYDHSFDSNSGAEYGLNEAAFLSGTGQFVLFGNNVTDFGGTNTGHVEIWEYYPEAD